MRSLVIMFCATLLGAVFPTPTTLARRCGATWERRTASSVLLAIGWHFTRPSAGKKWTLPFGELGRQKGWPGIADPSISIWQDGRERSIAASVPTTCRPVACLNRVAMAGLINKSAFLSSEILREPLREKRDPSLCFSRSGWHR